jgi:hypothetical protein
MAACEKREANAWPDFAKTAKIEELPAKNRLTAPLPCVMINYAQV